MQRKYLKKKSIVISQDAIVELHLKLSLSLAIYHSMEAKQQKENKHTNINIYWYSNVMCNLRNKT